MNTFSIPAEFVDSPVFTKMLTELKQEDAASRQSIRHEALTEIKNIRTESSAELKKLQPLAAKARKRVASAETELGDSRREFVRLKQDVHNAANPPKIKRLEKIVRENQSPLIAEFVGEMLAPIESSRTESLRSGSIDTGQVDTDTRMPITIGASNYQSLVTQLDALTVARHAAEKLGLTFDGADVQLAKKLDKLRESIPEVSTKLEPCVA